MSARVRVLTRGRICACSTETTRPLCSFYLPKCMLVLLYVCVSALMFLIHGRVPDRM